MNNRREWDCVAKVFTAKISTIDETQWVTILQWSSTDLDASCWWCHCGRCCYCNRHTYSIRTQIDVHSFINLTGLCLSGMCSNNRSLITAQWIVSCHTILHLFSSCNAVCRRCICVLSNTNPTNKRNIYKFLCTIASAISHVYRKEWHVHMVLYFFSFIFHFYHKWWSLYNERARAHTNVQGKMVFQPNRPIILCIMKIEKRTPFIAATSLTLCIIQAKVLWINFLSNTICWFMCVFFSIRILMKNGSCDLENARVWEINLWKFHNLKKIIPCN